MPPPNNPREMFGGIHALWNGRAVHGAVDADQHQNVRRVEFPLPEDADVQSQTFADAALGVLDLAVHLRGREVDELRRELGEQRLKPQALFQF